MMTHVQDNGVLIYQIIIFGKYDNFLPGVRSENQKCSQVPALKVQRPNLGNQTSASM